MAFRKLKNIKVGNFPTFIYLFDIILLWGIEYERQSFTHFFSYDSTAAFEDYLKVSDGEIITTEHFDMSNPETSRDDVPDYDNYSRTIDDLNQKYDNRLKKGIEIGYYQPREAEIINFL